MSEFWITLDRDDTFIPRSHFGYTTLSALWIYQALIFIPPLTYLAINILISTNETSTNRMRGAVQKERSYWITLSVQIEYDTPNVFRRQQICTNTHLLEMFEYQFQCDMVIEHG